MRRLLRILRPIDGLFLSFVLFLSLVSLFAVKNINDLVPFIAVNVVFTVAIFALLSAGNPSSLIRIIRDWYPAPSIYLIFKEVHVIIQSMGVSDWDPLFIKMDRFIFGIDPTVWMAQWINPLITEILQIAYASYFFIMLALGLELYLRKEFDKYNFAVFAVVFGFILSYFGYLLFPAVGPRFTLHDFHMIDAELPGIWSANFIRDFLNAGESIPRGASNAIEIAQRDVFPSGHTQMTLIVIILEFRYRLKSRYILTILGSLLIISTVYLRYHYVVDILGGIVFTLLTLWLAPYAIMWWERKTRNL